MNAIKFEQDNIERYMINLNEIVLTIKQNEQQGIENIDEYHKLYDLYRTLRTCYFKFSSSVQLLHAIPFQTWSSWLSGKNANQDLLEITNYIKRVDTFFKIFCEQIQTLPELYWREIPPIIYANYNGCAKQVSIIPPHYNENISNKESKTANQVCRVFEDVTNTTELEIVSQSKPLVNDVLVSNMNRGEPSFGVDIKASFNDVVVYNELTLPQTDVVYHLPIDSVTDKNIKFMLNSDSNDQFPSEKRVINKPNNQCLDEIDRSLQNVSMQQDSSSTVDGSSIASIVSTTDDDFLSDFISKSSSSSISFDSNTIENSTNSMTSSVSCDSETGSDIYIVFEEEVKVPPEEEIMSNQISKADVEAECFKDFVTSFLEISIIDKAITNLDKQFNDEVALVVSPKDIEDDFLSDAVSKSSLSPRSINQDSDTIDNSLDPMTSSCSCNTEFESDSDIGFEEKIKVQPERVNVEADCITDFDTSLQENSIINKPTIILTKPEHGIDDTEVSLKNVSMQQEYSSTIDDSSIAVKDSTTEENLLTDVDNLINDITRSFSCNTDLGSDSDVQTFKEEIMVQPEEKINVEADCITDFDTSLLENSIIDKENPFYVTLINQFKHVMINNKIDIQFIKDYYINDIVGYCRFITKVADLQNQNLIRLVMIGNEISTVELLSKT